MTYCKNHHRAVIALLLIVCCFSVSGQAGVFQTAEQGEKTRKIFDRGGLTEKTANVSETWMGVYMQGLKVGYSHSLEYDLFQNGQTFKRSTQKSWMKVSRLGGNPVEIRTEQDSLYDAKRNPLETTIRTKLSQNETMIRAEVKPDKIVFMSKEKITKELPCTEKFDFGVPLAEIIKTEGLRAGADYTFKILEPLTQSLIDISFQVLQEESILILGERKSLWHVRTTMTDIFPIVMDEWVDGKGEVWKSVSDAGFLKTTSIRMPKEKALEISDQNLDIAFSLMIPSNVKFENPQDVQEVTFKVSGIPLATIESLPFNGSNQLLLELKEDYALVQTRSVVFHEENAVTLPVQGEAFQRYLVPTTFCQSDDKEIVEAAAGIVSTERNSWSASKKIAEWVSREIKANYDVGFASAVEILHDREGDCSEHTVLMVALCRAVGIPARAAVGVMYGQGLFAYHMWPEVYVGEWVGLDAKWLAVDKQSGEYYTDATHLKLGDSALDEGIFKEMGQAMSEIIGKLKLEIVTYSQNQ